MDRLLPIPLIVLAGLTGPAIAVASGQARADRPVLVIAPPWRAPADLVEAAGGRLAAPLPAPLAAIAAPGAPDLPDRLRDAGAWFLLDGSAVLRLCGSGG